MASVQWNSMVINQIKVAFLAPNCFVSRTSQTRNHVPFSDYLLPPVWFSHFLSSSLKSFLTFALYSPHNISWLNSLLSHSATLILLFLLVLTAYCPHCILPYVMVGYPLDDLSFYPFGTLCKVFIFNYTLLVTQPKFVKLN